MSLSDVVEWSCNRLTWTDSRDPETGERTICGAQAGLSTCDQTIQYMLLVVACNIKNMNFFFRMVFSGARSAGASSRKFRGQTRRVSAQVPVRRSAKRGVGISPFHRPPNQQTSRLSHHLLCSATTITQRPQVRSSITSSTTTHFYLIQTWLVPRQVSSTHVDIVRLIAFG